MWYRCSMKLMQRLRLGQVAFWIHWQRIHYWTIGDWLVKWSSNTGFLNVLPWFIAKVTTISCVASLPDSANWSNVDWNSKYHIWQSALLSCHDLHLCEFRCSKRDVSLNVFWCFAYNKSQPARGISATALQDELGSASSCFCITKIRIVMEQPLASDPQWKNPWTLSPLREPILLYYIYTSYCIYVLNFGTQNLNSHSNCPCESGNFGTSMLNVAMDNPASDDYLPMELLNFLVV